MTATTILDHEQIEAPAATLADSLTDGLLKLVGILQAHPHIVESTGHRPYVVMDLQCDDPVQVKAIIDLLVEEGHYPLSPNALPRQMGGRLVMSKDNARFPVPHVTLNVWAKTPCQTCGQ